MATITTKQVTTFARRAAALTKANKNQTKLREEILNALLAGATLPTDGPYVIELAQNGGKDLDWQTEYKKLYARYVRLQNEYTPSQAKALAEAHALSVKEDAPDKPTLVINGIGYVGGVKFNSRVNAKPPAVREVA